MTALRLFEHGRRRALERRWTAAALPVACFAASCGGATEEPRPAEGPAPGVPGYYAAPVETAGGALDCTERVDVELQVVEDFELGAAGGWYSGNDVCAVCQELVEAADDIRNAGQTALDAAELAALAELQADLDACRPSCLAVTESPYFFDNPPVAEPIPGGRCNSRYAMHIKGGPFFDWGGSLGFNFSPPLNVTNMDVADPNTGELRPGRDLQGITFWGRLGGSSNNNVRIEVGEMHTDQAYVGSEGGPICTPDTTEDNDELGCDKFGATAQLRADWQQFLIPFAEMRQAGWGMRAERFDVSALLSFSISYAQGSWDFWIDDLAFYRRKQ